MSATSLPHTTTLFTVTSAATFRRHTAPGPSSTGRSDASIGAPIKARASCGSSGSSSASATMVSQLNQDGERPRPISPSRAPWRTASSSMTGPPSLAVSSGTQPGCGATVNSVVPPGTGGIAMPDPLAQPARARLRSGTMSATWSSAAASSKARAVRRQPVGRRNASQHQRVADRPERPSGRAERAEDVFPRLGAEIEQLDRTGVNPAAERQQEQPGQHDHQGRRRARPAAPRGGRNRTGEQQQRRPGAEPVEPFDWPPVPSSTGRLAPNTRTAAAKAATAGSSKRTHSPCRRRRAARPAAPARPRRRRRRTGTASLPAATRPGAG